MYGHGGYPVLFNRKNKDWASRTLANHPPPPPPLPTSDNISFLPYPAPALIPPHPLLQSGRHTFNRSPKFKRIEKMFGLKGLEINSLSPKP